MKNSITLLLLISILIPSYSQSQLITYTPDKDASYNDSFTVEARSVTKAVKGEWKKIHTYETFVQSGKIWTNSVRSTFVQFDFSGQVEVKITCNTCPTLESALVRPLSKNIEPQIIGKTLSFILDEPANLSVEVNNNRYENVHVFANPLDPGPGTRTYTSAAEVNRKMGKVKFHKGMNYYKASDNEVIYLAGGTVVRGNIYVKDVKNVKILGRGIIDLGGFKKRYSPKVPEGYDFYKGISIKDSENVTIDGVIVNDSQQYCIMISQSNDIHIKNTKVFSRVINGDGINLAATHDVVIDGCFVRSSDDGIPLNASRSHGKGKPELGDTYNIMVKNTSIYADNAHPITVGWSGYYDKTDPNAKRNWLRNITFENIDILEQDEHHEYAQGTMSVNCSEENRCKDITFKNIRVEDFSTGALLNVQLGTIGYGHGAVQEEGYRVDNVRFEDITYNGSGEGLSKLSGISCERYVNGVHFNNVRINGKLLTQASDYKQLAVGEFVEDITFNEEFPLVKNLSGEFVLESKSNTGVLQTALGNTSNPAPEAAVTGPNTNNLNQKWHLDFNEKGSFYTFKNVESNRYLGQSALLYRTNCLGAYVDVAAKQLNNAQKWQILDAGNGYYRLVNMESRNSLHAAVERISGRAEMNRVITIPWKHQDAKKWKLIPSSLPDISDPIEPALIDSAPSSTIEYSLLIDPSGRVVRIAQSEVGTPVVFIILDAANKPIETMQLTKKEHYMPLVLLKKGTYTCIIQNNGTQVWQDVLVKK